MDIARIQREFADAQRTFALVELRPTTDGNVYARTALQTTTGKQLRPLDQVPGHLPERDAARLHRCAGDHLIAPHRYQAGNICYLHPSMWNPGAHHLTFVIGRAAKWLNKYEVWRSNGGTWPGAEIRH